MNHVLSFTEDQVARMISDYQDIAERCRDELEKTTNTTRRMQLRDHVAEIEEILVILKRAKLPNPFENMEDMGKDAVKALGITSILSVNYDNDELIFTSSESLQHTRLNMIRHSIVPQIRLPYRVGAIARRKEFEERKGEYVYTLSFYRED